MIFNFRDVSHVSIKGLELELHFNDASSHMRRFKTVEEMLGTIESWQIRSAILDESRPEHHLLQTPISAQPIA